MQRQPELSYRSMLDESGVSLHVQSGVAVWRAAAGAADSGQSKLEQDAVMTHE